MGIREILRSFSRLGSAAAIMGIGCWVAAKYTAFTVHSRFLVQLLTFAGLIIGATVLYLGLAWLFRCPEVEEVYGIAVRRREEPGAYMEA